MAFLREINGNFNLKITQPLSSIINSKNEHDFKVSKVLKDSNT